MPQFAEFMVSYLERLQIVGGTPCDWMQLGKALERPSSTLRDLSLFQISENLDWLAGALQSQHCKLRRLALDRINEGLSQVLQSLSCRLQGLEIRRNEEEESLVNALRKSSSLWFFQARCEDTSSRLLQGVLKAPQLSHFVISVTHDNELHEAARRISKFLGSSDCRLQSFVTLFPVHNKLKDLLLRRQFQERVLDAVEGNYHSQLQQLQLGPWESDSLKVRCSNLLYRNQLSKGSPGRFFREFSQPLQVLKLFMCGHTGVGKTTVATNLLSSTATLISAIRLKRASTQGISLMNLEIGDGKKLLIFDLAGQEVYHAFHHYFIRRSENDLFLIVCKVEKNNAEVLNQEENLERLLTYWLRFIVSHQSSNAETMPKVFVVLNYFCSRHGLEYNASNAANKVLERFKTKINLMQPVLEVVAWRSKQLLALKEGLKHAAEVAAEHLPPIPKLCSDLIQEKASMCRRKWHHLGRTSREKTVFQMDELKKRLPDSGDEKARTNALKFALMCLHNMGEAIYFGSTGDAAKEATLANHAILDVKWFVQDVIGEFIPQLPRNDLCRGEGAISQLRVKLRKLVTIDNKKNPENQVNVIIKYLEEMGVLIRHWEDNNRIIIQTLLKNKFKCWQEDKKEKYKYWGRRMQPQKEDREFVLLPSGAFTSIQADIAKLCKSTKWQNQQTLSLGDGWISFSMNLVKVLVLVGGENEKWTDRQWVDILFMVPEDNIRCVKADKIMSSMRDCTFSLQRACPFLRIEEHVLNPNQVKAFLLHGPSNTRVQTKLLDELKDLAKTQGLGFYYSWDMDTHSCVGELLMLSELQHVLVSRQSVVEDFNSIAPVYKLRQSTAAIPKFADPENQKLAEYLTGILQGYFQHLDVSMQTVLNTLCRMEHSLKVNQEHILNSLSQMLQHIQVPKLPYLTDEENMLVKYSNLAGKKVRIHYMCESGELKHRVDHKGVSITIAHDWIRRYTSVLVPAILVSFFIAKVGATLAGIPVMGVLNLAEKGFKASLASGNLKAIINSCFGQNVDITQPAQPEVVEVLELVKKAAKEQTLAVLMDEHFGLFFHDGAWVCNKHRLCGLQA